MPTEAVLYKIENMTTKLNGKVALITGASAGIGQACARALAEEGARLVLTARRQERLNELEQQAEKLGTQAISVLGDAREESTAKKTVEAAMQTFGQIDILINNTGVGNYKNLVDTSAEEYDDMMDTNVGVSNSDMLEPEDVAGAVLLACKQSPGSRIIEIQMRTMAESLV